MTITSLRRLVVLFALLLFPATSFAQEAILSGTVTDTTGGVLPGVVVTAVHEASGNSFEAVTDSAGGYRISVRIGTYRIRARPDGLCDAGAHRPAGAGRPAGGRQPADVAGHASGIGDGHRRSAADQRDPVEPGKHDQRRAGREPAAQRPQLGGPDAPLGRQQTELRGRDAGRELSAERRRPAGHTAHRARASASRGSARTRSPSSRSSPTGSTRGRGARPACR